MHKNVSFLTLLLTAIHLFTLSGNCSYKSRVHALENGILRSTTTLYVTLPTANPLQYLTSIHLLKLNMLMYTVHMGYKTNNSSPHL